MESKSFWGKLNEMSYGEMYIYLYINLLRGDGEKADWWDWDQGNWGLTTGCFTQQFFTTQDSVWPPSLSF